MYHSTVPSDCRCLAYALALHCLLQESGLEILALLAAQISWDSIEANVGYEDIHHH
jgi:hypothetical protein